MKDYSLIAVKPSFTVFNPNFAQLGRFFFPESQSFKWLKCVFVTVRDLRETP